MRKTVRSDGATVVKFERGDKARRRYKRYLEDWRVRLPDPARDATGHMLRHRPEWYLDEAHILARPVLGLASLGRFAEWLLYMTQKRDPGGKSHVLAARLFNLVRKRMRAYMHMQKLDTYIRDKTTSVHAGACRTILAVAREAHAAYEALRRARRAARRAQPPRPLDTIHKDMI